jgi:hypothetical protein
MRRRTITCSILAALALGLSLLAPPERSRADAADLSHFTGTWRYADGPRGMRQIDAAVEHSIRGMPFYIVPFAREMVRGRTIHFRELRVEVRGNVVRFATESWGPVDVRLGAAPIAITAPEGTALELSERIGEAGRLIQLFEHPDGARENTFALSGDRQWLWMRVRIFSPQLPHECRYRLRYRRAHVAAR